MVPARVHLDLAPQHTLQMTLGWPPRCTYASSKHFGNGRCSRTQVLAQVQNASALEKKAIDDAIELVCEMLKMTPKLRASAAHIRASPFFHSDQPAPTPPTQLQGINTPESGSAVAAGAPPFLHCTWSGPHDNDRLPSTRSSSSVRTCA